MWEWFLPSEDRHKYVAAVMEGTFQSGGPLEPKVVGWLWGFLIGAVSGFVIGLVAVILT